MILYLIHDLGTDTYTHPLVGPDLQTVNHSLKTLNPENLNQLKVIQLDTLNSIQDLLYLRVSTSLRTKNKHKPQSGIVLK